MASSEALLWQNLGEKMTGTRRVIYRMMLQPFVPVLEIAQKNLSTIDVVAPLLCKRGGEMGPEYL